MCDHFGDDSFTLRTNMDHAAKLDALGSLFNGKECAAIKDLAERFDINEVQVVRQALRYFQLGMALNVTMPSDSPGCGVIE